VLNKALKLKIEKHQEGGMPFIRVRQMTIKPFKMFPIHSMHLPHQRHVTKIHKFLNDEWLLFMAVAFIVSRSNDWGAVSLLLTMQIKSITCNFDPVGMSGYPGATNEMRVGIKLGQYQ
jgi:hypothetical protein